MDETKDCYESDEESKPCSQVELMRLTVDTSNIIWLKHENSAVYHRKLESSQMIPRGGSIDDNILCAYSPKILSREKRQFRIFSAPASAFAKWYMRQMETHEIRTKCISAGFLAVIGDACAQEVARSFTLKHSMDDGGHYWSSSAMAITGVLSRLDKRRMLAMFFDGCLCTGPVLHFVYEFYEKILPIPDVTDDHSHLDKRKAIRRRFLTALAHVSFDNCVMAVFYVFLMMVVTATLEGKYHTIPHELQNDFFPAVKASWTASLMGLAPMQLMSFHFLPMELRVLAVNVQDVIWITVMSYVTHRNRH